MNSKTNPRAAAVDALIEIEQGAFTATALDQVLSSYNLSDRDSGLATEIIYGSIRMRATLDYYLNHISKQKVKKLEPRIRSILRSGAYQILFLDRVPESAAVNESVNLVSRRNRQRSAGFVNGVLRNLIRRQSEICFPDLATNPVEHIAFKYSHPQWMIERWLKRYGVEDTIKFCVINNATPKTDLRVNTLKISVSDLQAYLAKQGVEVNPGKYLPDVLTSELGTELLNDPFFNEGYFYLQNESSAMVAHAVQPQPGDIIYDLCAAPGGKSTHLAQLIKNEGQILALDNDHDRVKLIEANIERLGTSSVQARSGDASKIQLPQADKVLVDAPCSGLGVLRHKPDARWSKSLQDISELVKIQKSILLNAATLVKQGGQLIYSTCSTEPEENQEIIKWFLQKHPNFQLQTLPEWLPLTNDNKMLSILPFINEIDGFFICKMEKVR